MSTSRPDGNPPTDGDLEDWLYAAIAAGGPGLFDTLVTYTGHADPEIRSTAAYGLGEIEDDRAISPLIKLVDEDVDERVRDQALRALDSYRDPRILDCLIREVARVKRSRPPRQVVARQLRRYPSERAVLALTALLDDPDEFVKSDAAESLEIILSEL